MAGAAPRQDAVGWRVVEGVAVLVGEEHYWEQVRQALLDRGVDSSLCMMVCFDHGSAAPMLVSSLGAAHSFLCHFRPSKSCSGGLPIIRVAAHVLQVADRNSGFEQRIGLTSIQLRNFSLTVAPTGG